MSKKEQQQVIILGVLVAVIVGTLLFMNRDKLLPKGGAGASYAPLSRPSLPAPGSFDALFKRDDFTALRTFGDVPVKTGAVGNTDPFTPKTE